MAAVTNRAQLGALLRLKGWLTLRLFAHQKGRIVISILVILVMGALSISLAFASGAGYRNLEAQWPTALLGGVLVGLWGIWLLFPVFFGAINEGLNIIPLMIYPLPRRTLIASTLLGTLFDYPTYLMLPMFMAVVVGFGLSPALPVILIALLLSYGHMVVIGQLVTTAIGGFLRSRRVRDITIVLASLLGLSCYFINIGTQRFIEGINERLQGGDGAFVDGLANLQPLAVLQWFPTGAAARAVEQALAGSWGAALLWLGYSAVWLAFVTWIWYRLLVRLTTGGGFLLGAHRQQETAPPPTRQRTDRDWFSSLTNQLSPQLAILLDKNFLSWWRIPQRRVALIQLMLMPLFLFGFIFFSSDFSLVQFPSWIGLGLPLYALFLTWSGGQNMFGYEGKGLPTLLLTPVPREKILLAQGIANGTIMMVMFTIFGLIMIVGSRSWTAVAGLLTGWGMILTSTARDGCSRGAFSHPPES